MSSATQKTIEAGSDAKKLLDEVFQSMCPSGAVDLAAVGVKGGELFQTNVWLAAFAKNLQMASSTQNGAAQLYLMHAGSLEIICAPASDALKAIAQVTGKELDNVTGADWEDFVQSFTDETKEKLSGVMNFTHTIVTLNEFVFVPQGSLVDMRTASTAGSCALGVRKALFYNSTKSLQHLNAAHAAYPSPKNQEISLKVKPSEV